MDPFLRGEGGEEQSRKYEAGSWRFDEALQGRKFITSDMPQNCLILGFEPENRHLMWFAVPLSAELRLRGLCGDARMESGLATRRAAMSHMEMDLANLCVFESAARILYASSEAEILRASDQSKCQPPMGASPWGQASKSKRLSLCWRFACLLELLVQLA